ncbi:spermidine/putrescine ABC transporter substrate-binding protein [Candidatus Poribacteria bacterium]|nr:MAG: spermidine/putrescine ABC transporter substrate-binding protein [Candidatus Poribacteria bacterium]
MLNRTSPLYKCLKTIKFICSLLFYITIVTIFSTGCGDSQNQLNVFTWPGYISEEIRSGFEQEFGVKVILDTYGSNEDLLAKLKAGASGYDIIMPSDYMVSKMIQLDLITKLNHDMISNFDKISPDYLDKYFDPDNNYSIPYTFGTAGIAYDSSVITSVVDSWNVLWDKNYKNQFSMLDDPRETPGAALKLLGFSLNTKDINQLQQAKQKLIEQRELVKQYKNEAEELLISGDVVLAHCWSGDAFRAAEKRPSIKYVIPKEGSSQFIDNVCIPKAAPHVQLAHSFIDYLLRPEINAKISTFTMYGTCVPAAKEYLPKKLLEHEYIYPSKNTMDSLEWLKDLEDFTQKYSRAWDEVKAN